MTVSTGVGRGHGHHHHGPLGPRGTKKPSVSVASPPTVKSVVSKPPKAKGVGRGHGKHHHGAMPKAHHPHKKKVK